ncbi:MAG: MBL fold metallo-hydrolase [Myxococcales bacterium]|nr:MAG: MBL fold metallo-hydrolase [Myxococcales bacterium]
MMRFLVVLLSLALGGCGFFWRVTARSITSPPPAPVARRVAQLRPPGARLSAVWVGHATVLIQMDDVFVLTDPLLTRSAGLVSTRLVEPGLAPEHLPPLALVAISHMHFDHLSFDSLDEVESKTRVVVVPPGVKANMPRYDFEIRELPTWRSFEAAGVRVTAVPVRHVGGRYGLDEGFEPAAFTGYVFEYHGLSVYFGGDTAYAPELFAATRRRFPTLDLAILPICPMAPRDFMERTHVDPAEALDAFQLLGAKHMLPMHFDTLINSDDYPGQCTASLRRQMAARGMDATAVHALAVGEQRVFAP